MDDNSESPPQYDGPMPQVSGRIGSGVGRRLMQLFLFAVLLAAVGGGVWYWQQTKIKDLQAQVNNLNSDRATLQKTLDDLNAKIDKEKENNITVTYGEVVRDTDGRYSNGKANVIIINFTAENKGTGSQTINASDFKLTDAKDKVIATYASTPELVTAIKSWGLPDKLSVFDKATVNAGEKVSGALVFWNTDTTNTSFKITYNSKTAEIKVAKTTQVCKRDGTICE